MQPEWLTDGPEPVRSVAEALEQLSRHGAAIIADALPQDLLHEVQTALRRAAHTDRRYGLANDFAYGRDDHVNQRVWNLPSHDPVFCELAELPLALELVKAVLGWPALLSSMSANITHEGSASMLVHCDQGHLPGPLDRAWVLNLGWCVDDFTADNGATLILPGSHRLNGTRPDDDAMRHMVPAIAEAGSLLVLDGRTYHTNGVSTVAAPRAGIFAVYTVPVLLPQENWFLSLNPAVRQIASEDLLTLLGFRPQILGRINGLDRI